MSNKIELLYKKVFQNFITGKYGVPKIPEEKEVNDKIHEITQDNNDPITSSKRMDDVYIDVITTNFSSVIDDIDILYDSIGSHSSEIMDQLTYSLKEHNGVKRELRNIEQRGKDIQAGKTGIDYLKYVHTENFLTINNINTIQSTLSPDTRAPIVDVKSGNAYIPNSLMNLVDLTHYYGRKLEVINTGYIGHISDSGWEGHSDVAAILSISDPRRLVYRIKTSEPTSLVSSFIIQLHPDRNAIDINSIMIKLDSDNVGGQLRIEYRDKTIWKSIPDFPQKELDADKLTFKFKDISTTHLKFSFIKEYPDIVDSNEYFIILDDLSIIRAGTHKTATLYSKSIQMRPYDNEKVVIKNIAVNADGYIPEGCSVDISVAKDKLVGGYFNDINNNYVSPNSVHIDHFVPDTGNSHPERHVLLSDIKNNPNATGVIDYNQLEFDWKKVKSFKDSDNFKPVIINFADISSKDPYDNSLYQQASYLFGDPLFYSTYNIYPQPGLDLDPWFLSGVIDADNDYWTYMSGYVDQGLLISGHDYGDPEGYPFNYYHSDVSRYFRFGDDHHVINGWWRPEVQNVTVSGIKDDAIITDPVPDFYFNGMRFYKIFKIDPNSTPVKSSIRLYSYQNRPVVGGSDDYYPHNLIWNYNTKDIIKTAEFSTVNGWVDYNSATQTTFPENNAFAIPLYSGQELVENSVREVHYQGHSNILTIDTHYRLNQNVDNGRWFMNMIPVSSGIVYHPDAHISLKYSYKYEDKYTSYWDGYIVSDEDSTIVINQIFLASYAEINGTIVPGESVVGDIIITTLEGDSVYNASISEQNVSININKGVYHIRIFCLSDKGTTYAAKYWAPHSNKFIETGPSLKIVPRFEPIKMTNFDILLHSTPYENDNRAAIIEDIDNSKYIVVKEPSRNILPGYYYDNYISSYTKNDTNLIRNIGHYKRKYIVHSGISGYYDEHYITGSSGNIVMSGDYLDFNSYTQDNSWNNGYVYPPGHENYDQTILYPQHSTFGSSINIEDNPNNSGHLFYNTGENLPAFYTIEYGTVNKYDKTVDRFLYRIQLNSEHEVNTPVLSSLKFVINEEEEI